MKALKASFLYGLIFSPLMSFFSIVFFYGDWHLFIIANIVGLLLGLVTAIALAGCCDDTDNFVR